MIVSANCWAFSLTGLRPSSTRYARFMTRVNAATYPLAAQAAARIPIARPRPAPALEKKLSMRPTSVSVRNSSEEAWLISPVSLGTSTSPIPLSFINDTMHSSAGKMVSTV